MKNAVTKQPAKVVRYATEYGSYTGIMQEGNKYATICYIDSFPVSIKRVPKDSELRYMQELEQPTLDSAITSILTAAERYGIYRGAYAFLAQIADKIGTDVTNYNIKGIDNDG